MLEELQSHPDVGLLRVLQLGEGVPGFNWPVEPLPIEPDQLSRDIAQTIRAGEEQWAVHESTQAHDEVPAPAPHDAEPEDWRATAPPELTTPPGTLEDRLFGDFAADVEAQALQSVESALRRPPPEAARVEETSPAEAALDRAQAMVLESRAVAEAAQREEEARQAAQQQLEESVARLTAELDEATRNASGDHAALAAQLEEARAGHARLAAEFDEATQRANTQLDEARAENTRLAAEFDEATQRANAQLDEARAETERVSALLEETATQRDALTAQLDGATTEFTRLARALNDATGSTEAALAERARLVTELDAARTREAALTGEVDTLSGKLRESQGELDDARTRLNSLNADLAGASDMLEDTARERDALKSHVATLEPKLALEQQRVQELEAREVMPVELPGKRMVGLARHGVVGLDGLSRVVSQVVLANLETRVELGVEGGLRTLYFKRGQLIAAESTLEHESLLTRARRDGLIDRKQESELRGLQHATPREQLDALKSRGFIRDIESVPLVQRYTEQVALDAFCEDHTNYRLVDDAPPPTVLLATVPRPTLPMLAESLRRAVTPDVLLERLGGGEAIPTVNESELDLRALGFSERERKMLSWVDGEATIEDLSLASGLKPDAAFRALLVAHYLGLLNLKPGRPRTVESVSGQLDINRLNARYDELQDADYFTILGLPRVAGAEDVRRAFQRLSQEFDPLRFSGHPDPGLQQRAQVVAKLLEEAAGALEDDRRRAEYARHLLD